MGPLTVFGLLCAILAMISIIVGSMALDPVCGGFALIFSIVGLIMGGIVWGSDPANGKKVVAMNLVFLITVILIFIIVMAIGG